MRCPTLHPDLAAELAARLHSHQPCVFTDQPHIGDDPRDNKQGRTRPQHLVQPARRARKRPQPSYVSTRPCAPIHGVDSLEAFLRLVVISGIRV